MNSNLLSGVWSYPSNSFPGNDDVMWVDEVRRRIITIVVAKIDPVKRLACRMWYEPESEFSIRTRLKPTGTWRSQEFRIEPDRLVWIHPGGDQTGTRLSPNEYPEWLEAEVAAAHARMDEMERSTE